MSQLPARSSDAGWLGSKTSRRGNCRKLSGAPIFDILNVVKPNVIALGYDQKHSVDSIRTGLDEHGFSDVELTRVDGLSDDLDGTRKIIARILDL